MPQRVDDGSPIAADPTHWPKLKLKFRKIVTFAVPLTVVTDTASLEAKVTEPLIKLTEQAIATP
jgi:hypothetical protein